MDEERQRGGTLLAHIKGHENEDESQVCCTSPLGRQKRELRRNITQRVSRGLGNRVPSLLFDIEVRKRQGRKSEFSRTRGKSGVSIAD
jgi:hypothetical protein